MVEKLQSLRSHTWQTMNQFSHIKHPSMNLAIIYANSSTFIFIPPHLVEILHCQYRNIAIFQDIWKIDSPIRYGLRFLILSSGFQPQPLMGFWKLNWTIWTAARANLLSRNDSFYQYLHNRTDEFDTSGTIAKLNNTIMQQFLNAFEKDFGWSSNKLNKEENWLTQPRAVRVRNDILSPQHVKRELESRLNPSDRDGVRPFRRHTVFSSDLKQTGGNREKKRRIIWAVSQFDMHIFESSFNGLEEFNGRKSWDDRSPQTMIEKFFRGDFLAEKLSEEIRWGKTLLTMVRERLKEVTIQKISAKLLEMAAKDTNSQPTLPTFLGQYLCAYLHKYFSWNHL